MEKQPRPWSETLPFDLRRAAAFDRGLCRVVRAILEAPGLPTEPPVVHPARGPPDELVRE